MFLRDIQNNEKKINHEGHEAHEDAQSFKSGDRRSPFVNFVLFRTGCSGG